jgi:hypothetical protein
MQSAGRSQRLIARAKHHRENSVERLVEPANRISKSPGMLGDGCGDPGVCQLKQQGAAGAKEDGRLAAPGLGRPPMFTAFRRKRESLSAPRVKGFDQPAA